MNSTFTAVSLFTGAGGMDVGFERAGINIVFANEMMSEAAQTYSANHPDGIMVNDDIHNQIETIDRFEGADIVFGVLGNYLLSYLHLCQLVSYDQIPKILYL